jgi:hypothetical protein
VTSSWAWPNGGAVDVWDVARGERVHSLDKEANPYPFSAVAFAPGGAAVALGILAVRSAPETSVHLWDASTGEKLQHLGASIELPAAAQPLVRNLPHSVERVASLPLGAICFSPDGRVLAIVSGTGIKLTELASGEVRAIVDEFPVDKRAPGSEMLIRAIAIAPGGRLLVAGFPDGTIRSYDLLGDRALPPLVGHVAAVEAFCFLPDGQRLLSFGRDHQLMEWSLERLGAQPPAPVVLGPERFQPLWDALGGANPKARQRAKQRLVESADAVTHLREHLRPAVAPANLERAVAFAAALGSSDPHERQAAEAELRKLGDFALPALERAAQRGLNNSLQALLTELQSKYPTAEQARAYHAMDVLQRIGDDAARTLLEELAAGAPESILTMRAQEATASLQTHRIFRRQSVPLSVLWIDLAAEDARCAYRAICALAQRNDAGDFLAVQIRRLARQLTDEGAAESVARLVGTLDHDDFQVREQASATLAQLGPSIHVDLQSALVRGVSVEARLRLEALLRKPRDTGPPPKHLQLLRGIEALELATPESSAGMLADLARETPAGWVRDALARSTGRENR